MKEYKFTEETLITFAVAIAKQLVTHILSKEDIARILGNINSFKLSDGDKTPNDVINKFVVVDGDHIRVANDKDASILGVAQSTEGDYVVVVSSGEVNVIDDGTCVDGGYAVITPYGTATNSDNPTSIKVVQRTGDDTIRAIIGTTISNTVQNVKGTEVQNFIVTVSSNNNEWGNVQGGGVIEDGQVTVVGAAPNTGYKFTGWEMDGKIISTDKVYHLQVESDCQLTAIFAEIKMYTINTSIDLDEGGSVTESNTYEDGTEVTLVATLNPGYKFIGWYENGSKVSDDLSYTFPATSDRIILASFVALESYTIVVNCNDVYGTVTGAGVCIEGASMTITANPNDGYEFVGWQINGSTISTDESYTFTPSNDVTIDALFKRTIQSRIPGDYVELEYIQVQGLNASSPAGYSVGGQRIIPSYSNMINPPDDNIVRAGRIYLDYQLDSIPAGSTYAASNATILGARVDAKSYDVVTSSYRGIYCSANQITFVYAGTGGWPTKTIQRTMLPERTKLDINLINRVMQINDDTYEFELDVSSTSKPYFNGFHFATDRYSDGITGGHPHAAASGKLYESIAWDRDLVCISHCIPVKRLSDGKVGLYDLINRHFMAADTGTNNSISQTAGPEIGETELYNINVELTDPAGGVISGDSSIIPGKIATITATPNDGYKFIGWIINGELASTSRTYQFDTADDPSIKAYFLIDSRCIVTTQCDLVDGFEAGTATGGGEYAKGDTITLVASPLDTFVFKEWVVNDEIVSSDTSYTFTVDDYITIHAVFEPAVKKRLPLGYTELEYLYIPQDSSQASNLNYVPWINVPATANATKLHVKFLTTKVNTSTSASAVLGYSTYKNSTNYWYAIGFLSKAIEFFGGLYTSSSYRFDVINPAVVNTIYEADVDITNKKLTINEVEKALTGSTNWVKNAMRLFGISRGTSTTISDISPKDVRVYAATWTDDNGNILRELVPAMNDAGEYGMFDTISKTFLTNANTTTSKYRIEFAGGPAVS